MKCPNCNFVCSDLRDICPKCIFDLRGYKKAVGLPISYPKLSYTELALKTNPQLRRKKKKKTQDNLVLKKEVVSAVLVEPVFSKFKNFFKKSTPEKPAETAPTVPVVTPPIMRTIPEAPALEQAIENRVESAPVESTPIVSTAEIFNDSKLEIPPSPSPAPLDLSDPETWEQFLNESAEQKHDFEHVPGDPKPIKERPSLSKDFSVEFDFEHSFEELETGEEDSDEEDIEDDLVDDSDSTVEPSLDDLRRRTLAGKSNVDLDAISFENEPPEKIQSNEPSLATLRHLLSLSSPVTDISHGLISSRISESSLFEAAYASLPKEQANFEISIAQFYQLDNLPEISILFDLADAALEDPESANRYLDDVYSHHSGQINSSDLQSQLKKTEAQLDEMGPSWRRDSTEKVNDILLLPRSHAASFARRFGSGLIDSTLTLILSGVVAFLLVNSSDRNFHLLSETMSNTRTPEIAFFGGIWISVLPVVATIYLLLGHLSFGLTLGEVTAGIRLTTTDGITPKRQRIVARDILYPLSALLTLLVFPLVFFRSLADKWAKTRLSVLED